jgi:hypothetical protein
MPINKRIGLKPAHFAGAGHVFSQEAEGLAAVIRNNLIRDAQDLLVAVGTGALTDNSGGLAGILFTADDTTDLIALVAVADESFATGDGPFEMLNDSGGLPAGLATSTDYWVRRFSATEYKVYLTKAAAIDPVNDDAVNITGTGTGTHHFQAIGLPTIPGTTDASGDNTLGFTAASGDTSFDTIMTSYATLAERANLLLDSIGAGDILDGPGTGGSGTIAVTDVDVETGSSDTTCCEWAAFAAVYREINNSQATVIDVVDVCLVAVGLAKVPRARNLKGSIDLGGVNGDNAITNMDATVTATLVAVADEDEIEVWLNGLTDNIAFLADQLDLAEGVAADAAPSTYAS